MKYQNEMVKFVVVNTVVIEKSKFFFDALIQLTAKTESQ